jgi:hypothetical protein
MASDDPEFEVKAANIIGLYLNPPQHAAVFCTCGWIKHHRRKDRYCLEQTSASALRGSYAPELQKQSSISLKSADVVRDVANTMY